MKHMVIVVLIASLFAACTHVPISHDKTEWHAYVYETVKGRHDLKIVASEWVPIVNAEGFGGSREVVLTSIELTGAGPNYHVQSTSLKSSKYPDWQGTYDGVAIFDSKTKKVLVDLKRDAAKSGEPVRLVAFPYNGNYRVTKGWEFVNSRE